MQGRLRKKTQLLPIVIPARGVDGECWPPKVLEAFARCGMVFSGIINGPLFRPPASPDCSELCARGLTSSESTRFLRMFCGEPPVQASEDEPKLSSHSLKATCISWVSKFGIGASDKAVLGRHSSAVNESAAVYSRDVSVRSVCILQNVTLDIFSGVFTPDSARSGYFRRQLASVNLVDDPAADVRNADAVVSDPVKCEVGCEINCEQPNIVESDSEVFSETTGTDCEQSSDPDEDPLELARPAKAGRVEQHEETKPMFFKHRTSKLMHYLPVTPAAALRASQVLACGKRVSGMFERADSFRLVGLCKLCRVHATRDGVYDSSEG